jgi:predicted PurR-regulated permease PerM
MAAINFGKARRGGAYPATGEADSHIRKALGLALLFALVAGCFVVLRPFIVAILWAAILVVTTWPVYQWLERRLNQRRSLAAAVMTLGLAAVLLLPLVMLGASLTDNVLQLSETVRSAMTTSGLPPPPAWLHDIPLAGPRLEQSWLAASADTASFRATIQEHIGPIRDWLLARGADLLQGMLQLTLSLITSFFFYRDGPAIRRAADAILGRISGSPAHRFSETAGSTISGVVYGVLGTAVVQAILAGLGYRLAGVPGALFLGFVSFFLALIPAGLVIIWLPAAFWLAGQGEKEWAIFVAVWGLFVGALDNVLRPYLIGRGSDLPFLLVFLGVIGGAVGFGLVGIFLGPTLLALAYGLAREWGSDETIQAKPATAPRAAAQDDAGLHLHP